MNDFYVVSPATSWRHFIMQRMLCYICRIVTERNSISSSKRRNNWGHFDCFRCEMIELPKHDMEHCNFSFLLEMEHCHFFFFLLEMEHCNYWLHARVWLNLFYIMTCTIWVILNYANSFLFCICFVCIWNNRLANLEELN